MVPDITRVARFEQEVFVRARLLSAKGCPSSTQLARLPLYSLGYSKLDAYRADCSASSILASTAVPKIRTWSWVAAFEDGQVAKLSIRASPAWWAPRALLDSVQNSLLIVVNWSQGLGWGL